MDLLPGRALKKGSFILGTPFCLEGPGQIGSARWPELCLRQIMPGAGLLTNRVKRPELMAAMTL